MIYRLGSVPVECWWTCQTSEGFLSGMKRSEMQSKKLSRVPFDSASLRALATITNAQAGDCHMLTLGEQRYPQDHCQMSELIQHGAQTNWPHTELACPVDGIMPDHSSDRPSDRDDGISYNETCNS